MANYSSPRIAEAKRKILNGEIDFQLTKEWIEILTYKGVDILAIKAIFLSVDPSPDSSHDKNISKLAAIYFQKGTLLDKIKKHSSAAGKSTIERLTKKYNIVSTGTTLTNTTLTLPRLMECFPRVAMKIHARLIKRGKFKDCRHPDSDYLSVMPKVCQTPIFAAIIPLTMGPIAVDLLKYHAAWLVDFHLTITPNKPISMMQMRVYQMVAAASEILNENEKTATLIELGVITKEGENYAAKWMDPDFLNNAFMYGHKLDSVDKDLSNDLDYCIRIKDKVYVHTVNEVMQKVYESTNSFKVIR